MSVNFGAFPGTDVATVAVVGQAGIVAGSLVDAWLVSETTADHSEDEHAMLQNYVTVTVARSTIVAGTGFTITAMCDDKSRMFGLLRLNWTWV